MSITHLLIIKTSVNEKNENSNNLKHWNRRSSSKDLLIEELSVK